jgi:hypothetical protein
LISHFRKSGFGGAVRTAVNGLVSLDSMSDDPASTTRAGWSQGVNRTLKAVENVLFSANRHFKSFVVVISTSFTFGHLTVSSA